MGHIVITMDEIVVAVTTDPKNRYITVSRHGLSWHEFFFATKEKKN